MKRIFGLFIGLSTFGLAAQAQSTMPAIGANTPKGEVSKTDASLNQTNTAERSNTSTKASKHTRKTKTTKSKTMSPSAM